MTCKRRLLALLAALLLSASLHSSRADITASLKNPQPSSVTIDEPGARKKVQSSSGSSSSSAIVEQQRGREPPGSPVNLFMPDEFQFYTLNNNGQLVMKQMTKQEIQGMIAAGGNGLPVDMGHHQTKVPEGEPKVADVVQNVQNVLKGELSKPAASVHAGATSIPGSVNSQWTNMLPYILSGGTVDQQDIAQDTSMILSTLGDDQSSSYVDVVPLLQNGKPADDGGYEPTDLYSQPKPTLLGNMALDSGILGERETTKRRPAPSRPPPTTTTYYPRFTTTRPSLDDSPSSKNNSSKPTLYIPLSVSPSLLAVQQQQQQNDLNRVPVYAAARPNQQSSTTKKTTTSSTTHAAYPDSSAAFTRLPMIQVPVIEADKLSTKSQQKTPVYEILPTISPVTTTAKDTLKVNIGPMGGFKKPSTGQRPTSSYRPIYEPITYRPVYEPSSSRRPVYEPTTHTTGKASTASVYELVTKPSTRVTDREASTTLAVDTTTYRLPEKTTDQVSFAVEPIKVEDESTTVVYYTSSSDKSTQKQTTDEYTTTSREVETSATTLRDSYEPIVTSKPDYVEAKTTTQKPATKQTEEQTQSWTESETTTALYQSSSAAAAAATTTSKSEYPDSTIRPEVQDDDDDDDVDEIPTVPPMLSEAINSIIGSIESKPPLFYETVTYDAPDETTIDSKVDLTTEAADAGKLADTTTAAFETTYVTKKRTEFKERPPATTTEMYVMKKQPQLEDEVSTVKVIPIYDDDDVALMYTRLPADSTTKLASTTRLPDKLEASTTTQSDLPLQDTLLPGLEETFNNYMKEHYDPKLATTGNYDDIVHMTTFPTMILEKASASDRGKTPILSETDWTPTTYVPESTETTEESTTTEADGTTKSSSAETPIIFLDVSSSPEKELLPTKDIGNSSLTRIKVNNPTADVDKIIADSVLLPTNTPPTVGYTLPAVSKPANNIASGIIAGYPTYSSQVKPITEYVSSSSSTEKIVSYQTVQTTSLPDTSYESFTQIPFDSLPIMRRKPAATTTTTTTQQSADDPLEKISDLINQLQNSPADIGYDNSNGIATTIVPLDRFETIVSESTTTPRDEILTTIMENLSKTSSEPQNTTYVVIQTTLPQSSSTQAVVQSTTAATTTTTTTTKKIVSQRPSTTEAVKTTVVTVVKQQPVTGRPYVASTYSTTKSSIDKIQSTIDKSAGRINLEEEKTKAPVVRPTEPAKFTMKNKLHYSTLRRPTIDYQTYTRKTTKPIVRTTSTSTTSTTTTTTTTTGKPVEDSSSEKWTLIPQKVVATEQQNEDLRKVQVKESTPIVTLEHAKGAIGLDQSNKDLDRDVADFLSMCNELSFQFWTLANSGLSSSRSITMSPFGMISTLAMIFLGARGLTSNAMNDILKLDDVVTFNPHLVFQNITDAVTLARGQGIENAAFVRALFADRLKVRKIMPFYKEQAQQFYEGAVVDVNFSTAGDILRRRTNLLIRKQTGGRIKDFVKGQAVGLRSPLTALSANVFQTSCDSADASSEGRDGEMYFAVAQTVKQRKLVPIPAVVWRAGVSAGYEPSLDATAVALGDPKRPVSLIMVMPGQQGLTAAGDNLERLESRLFGNPADNALEKLLKVVIPRRVELQMPKFSQRSVLNVTSALRRMGFEQLFTKTADLKGINGAGHDLFLAEMIQMNLFSTCGDDNKAGVRHLAETYPGTAPRHTRAWELLNNINNNNNSEQQNVNECDEEDPAAEVEASDSSPSGSDLRQKIQKSRLRWYGSSRRRRCRSKRQAGGEAERPRMKMDKPFLYLIRHNLSGLILHMGRFNPKNQS